MLPAPGTQGGLQKLTKGMSLVAQWLRIGFQHRVVQSPVGPVPVCPSDRAQGHPRVNQMLKEKAKEGNGSFPRTCRSEAISAKPHS